MHEYMIAMGLGAVGVLFLLVVVLLKRFIRNTFSSNSLVKPLDDLNPPSGYMCNKTLTDFIGRTCFTEGMVYQEEKPSSRPESYLTLIDDLDRCHHVTRGEDILDGWRVYFKELTNLKEERDHGTTKTKKRG